MKKYVGKIIIALFIVLFIAGCFIQAPITEAIGSLWSLLPPIIAIGLALITKEVYSSLFIGILTGGIVYAVATNGGFEGMFTTVIQDGLIANLADSYNVGILVFLVVLGVIVVLMNKAEAAPTENGRRLTSKAAREQHFPRSCWACSSSLTTTSTA